jgi:hypothetical protein
VLRTPQGAAIHPVSLGHGISRAADRFKDSGL